MKPTVTRGGRGGHVAPPRLTHCVACGRPALLEGRHAPHASTHPATSIEGHGCAPHEGVCFGVDKARVESSVRMSLDAAFDARQNAPGIAARARQPTLPHQVNVCTRRLHAQCKAQLWRELTTHSTPADVGIIASRAAASGIATATVELVQRHRTPGKG
jgi:hypothetical protein